MIKYAVTTKTATMATMNNSCSDVVFSEEYGTAMMMEYLAENDANSCDDGISFSPLL